MGRLLNALEHQIEVTARTGEPDYKLILGIAEYFCDYPDRCHHPKEIAVFDHLRAKYPQEAKAIVDLTTEHTNTHQRVSLFRRVFYEILQDAIIPRSTLVFAARSFIRAERRHMRMEEEDFFPLAEKCFVLEDWSCVEECLAKNGQPLFVNQVENEFKGISERLLEWEKQYMPD
jgi:hemerythrin-like domain-containing protein